MTDIFTGILLIIAGFFCLVAALGVVRFGDFFNRLHAAAKASTLGIGSALIAATIFFGDGAILFEALLSIFFLFLTVPLGAQLLAQSQWTKDKEKEDRTDDR
jgi:monovalent cation/proton antiporter MnhG/PhaG subunit